MSDFSLDVVFNSATMPFVTVITKLGPTPVYVPPPPIYAMGFGFSESGEGGIWKEEGQPVEVVPVGASFFVSVFDTAPKSQASVTNIVVTFFDPDNRFVLWPYSPLGLPWEKGTQPNPLSSQPWYAVMKGQNSPGCNVANASVWRLGPYVVRMPAGIPTLRLGCTVQVTLLVDPKDPNSTKVFSVDPEIQVDGGG
jgi:hypothetical protein